MTDKYAWCTLLMKGDDYLPGVIALGVSIKKTAISVYDYIVMVTDDVSLNARNDLLKIGAIIVDVPYIKIESKPLISKKQNEIYSSWMAISYTKWNALTLTNYEKVCFLDADTIMIHNCDHLFEMQAPAAMFTNPWIEIKNKKQFTTSTYYNINNTRLSYGDIVNPKHILKGLSNSFVCFGSIVLLNTSIEHYHEYVNMLTSSTPYECGRSISSHDETSLCKFYISKNVEFRNISVAYGYIPWFSGWMDINETPMIIHYHGKKIWHPEITKMMDESKWDDADLWYIIANYCYRNFDMQCMNFNYRIKNTCFLCFEAHPFLDPDTLICTCNNINLYK
jgi:alpha-N-acetylglucosamine transferase